MTEPKFFDTSKQKLKTGLERASSPLRRIWPKLPEAVIGLLALVVVVFATATSSPALTRKASEVFQTDNATLALIEGVTNPFRNRAFLLKSGLPVFDLSMKPQALAEIENVVAEARQQGWMSDEMKCWVSGQLLYNGKTHNIQARVRGDLATHWDGPKKSWRLKFVKEKIQDGDEKRKEDIYFEGMRQINLILPRDRDFVVAPFVNELMREAGLLTTRDQFVVLRLNGRLQGLYYMVEHFDKPLCANRGRPETTIFGQNDRAMHFEQYSKLGTPAVSDARFDIGCLRRGVDPAGDLSVRAMQVLFDHSLNPTPANFRRAREVLDWAKYMQFRNLTTLFNTNHVKFGSDNLRLYFDPSRGLLEPVPWDVHLIRLPKEPGTIDFWNDHGPDELQRATLSDPQLRKERNKMLWDLVGRDDGKYLIHKYAKLHDQIRPMAWADVLNTPIQGQKMDVVKKNFEYNVRRIHKVLAHSSANLSYRLEAGDRAALEFACLNFCGVRLGDITLSQNDLLDGEYRLFEDSNANGVLDDADPLHATATAAAGTVQFSLDQELLPEVHYGSALIENVHWEFMEPLAGRRRFFVVGRLAPDVRDPLEWTPPEITVTAANAVTGETMSSGMIQEGKALPSSSVGIIALDTSDPFDLDAIGLSLEQFLAANPEFSASQERPGAAELTGQVTINRTVFVPRAVPLIFTPGVDVTITPGNSVLCYGGVQSKGTAEAPIRIHGDASGKPWGVFGIVRPPEPVVLRHTEFSDASQAQLNAILFTGGFAVHNGDLDMQFCRFTQMQSEDGVNIKNGHLEMHDCVIDGTSSDGIDIDFGVGTVRDCQFLNIAGDGVDLSGSKILVTGCRFEKIGDKGISVGENSHPLIINNLIHGCNIGIASKDLSHPRIAFCTIVGNELGFEAKRKKPFFGGASAEIFNCVFAENKLFLSEDYFSKGKVSIENSLLDAAFGSSTCQNTSAAFRSREAGDFRLDAEQSGTREFKLGAADWIKLDSKDVTAEQPGIITNLKSTPTKEQ